MSLITSVSIMDCEWSIILASGEAVDVNKRARERDAEIPGRVDLSNESSHLLLCRLCSSRENLPCKTKII